ncbi:MAG: acyltransferase [Pseudomonadota bacterium]
MKPKIVKMNLDAFLARIRRQETPFYRFLYRLGKRLYGGRPPLGFLGGLFYRERLIRRMVWGLLITKLYYEPMFRYRVKAGSNLQLEGVMPLIIGPGEITLGDRVRVGKSCCWIVGSKVHERARLSVGDDTSINFATIISVAQEVRIGSRCLIAGQVNIYDNNSHPTDPEKRACHLPLEPGDVRPVIIEDDVWLGQCSMVLKGVTVGRGSTVAAGAVVTKSVPPYCIVAGNPAVVVKKLPRPGGQP